MVPPSTLDLPDGRRLAYDDVGDASGPVVVYLHGTPDSRLGRPPDVVTEGAGVRLLAVDRPGIGGSDRHPGAPLVALGADLVVLLDHLDVDRTCLLGWSAGGLHALAAATVLGARVDGVGVVAAVPPVEAYADAVLVAAAAPARRHFAELAGEVAPQELAEELAPYLVPDPLTPEMAREHVQEEVGEGDRAAAAGIPGALDALAAGLRAAVEGGRGGLVDEVVHQLEPGLDLTAVVAPVRCWHGADDGTSPPEVGTWLVDHLGRAVLDVSPDAGHHLLFPRWRAILRGLRRDAGI